jgi:thioesterase domain-containing protein/FPC/CPF motif-containing protein YcgG
VVPEEGAELDAAALRSALEGRLPAYMVPPSLLFLDRLPLTPHGKVDRKALEERGLARPEPAGAVAPRDLLELVLVQLWERLLNVRPIGVRDNFFALGGHSLLAVRLIAEIRHRFGRDLPLAALFENGTVEALACLLRGRSEAGAWSPLVPIRTGGSRLPFFCVHPVGGSVLGYAALAHHIGPDQPFYGLQAELDGDGALCGSLGEMADCYIEALREVQPHGPYQLGGWSFGGLVAFEMACRLRARGEEVLLVALLDTRPPTRSHPPESEDELLVSFARLLAQDSGKDFESLHDELLRQPRDERLGFIVEQGKRAGLLPPDTGPDRIRRLLDVYRSNSAAGWAYVPGVYPGRVTLFRASERPAGPEGEDWVAEWSVLAAGGVELCPVPGKHQTMVTEPNVLGLAAALGRCLAPRAREARFDLRYDVLHAAQFDEERRELADERLAPAPESLLWTQAQLEMALAEQRLAGWAREAYDTFKTKVSDPRFPCTFGIVAQQRGTLLYSFARSLRAQADRLHIQSLIREYLSRLQRLTKEESSFTLLVLFTDPQSLPPDLDAHHQEVWDLLQYLHEEDSSPWAPGVSTDPDHPLWSFCLAGSPLFVNISSPAHRQRKSRNLGSALILIIQLREGFDLVAPNTPAGRRVRGIIRDRLEAFDELPIYSELGYYKDPRNREWKQYGIPDGPEPQMTRCPFRLRKE